jgi:hypothetical protein
MSFLKKLFGLGGSGAEETIPAAVSEVEHKGFRIRATPFKEAGQYQTCGVISKEVNGVLKEHKFIRADRFPALETAAEIAISKGKQIVDEQGERLFG